MNGMLRGYIWVRLQLEALCEDERGDQNIGFLGLIIVTVAVIGFLTTRFVPALEGIFCSVIAKLAGALGVTAPQC